MILNIEPEQVNPGCGASLARTYGRGFAARRASTYSKYRNTFPRPETQGICHSAAERVFRPDARGDHRGVERRDPHRRPAARSARPAVAARRSCAPALSGEPRARTDPGPAGLPEHGGASRAAPTRGMVEDVIERLETWGRLLSDLPPVDCRRWTPLRKSRVVRAVRSGALVPRAAAERYGISKEELRDWLLRDQLAGTAALRVTRRIIPRVHEDRSAVHGRPDAIGAERSASES